jgi:hypothetical protein
MDPLFAQMIHFRRKMPFFGHFGEYSHVGFLKIVASGPISGREAEPYEGTVSIAGPRLGHAVDF